MFKPINKNAQRKKRHFRIRSRIKGTASKPRLNVFRSNRQMYCQLIDDKEGKTLASASTLELNDVNGANKEGAKAVGELIAKRALDKKIEAVVFDRSGYLYHGRVKALAEAAREAGLDF
jgi:large subunit ribosomal protein L18